MNDMGGMRRHMKKTFIFMLLAGLSLAAPPLVTMGFWSKDAIFAPILESGYVHASPLFIVAVVVAAMTAFYTFRMIGMAFFGKPSPHIQEMLQTGSPSTRSHSTDVGSIRRVGSCNDSHRCCWICV